MSPPKKNITRNNHPRESEIILQGISGQKPKIPLRMDLLEEQALKMLSPNASAFLDGRAGHEDTIIENNKAFLKWVIAPHVIKDISEINTSIELFGVTHDYPFMLAPLGMHKIASKLAEPAVARAAAAENILMAFSTQASTPMESVASVMGDAKRWYQIYISKSDEFNRSLIKRAESCGCRALIITVDNQTYGWRTKELARGSNPFVHNFHGLAQYSSDPIFQKLLDEYNPSEEDVLQFKKNLRVVINYIKMTRNYPGSFIKNFLSGRVLDALRLISNLFGNFTLSWEDISAIKKITSLPILVKGILRPDDAKLAIDYGIDGIVVSSHGGRQLSGGITSIDALPPIVEAVNKQIPILLDSGIRGGADIFKAIALGANAVMIGRPYLHALTIAGEDGVRELLRNLKAEFEITMALSGCRDIKEITPDMLRRI